MRKFAIFVVFVLMIMPSTVRAEGILTDSQLETIQTSCVDAQISLQQVQVSERVTRTNRGQAYESLGKLMTNLNSRVVQNQLNAPGLISISSDYQKALTAFRSDFNSYDDALTELSKMDCRNQPTTFNDRLIVVREKRARLREDVTTLDTLIDKYQQDVDVLKQGTGLAG